jgi:hypothetical protein
MNTLRLLNQAHALSTLSKIIFRTWPPFASGQIGIRARRLACKALQRNHYLNKAAIWYLDDYGVPIKMIETLKSALKDGVGRWRKVYEHILEDLQMPLPDEPGPVEMLRTSSIDFEDLPLIVGFHENPELAIIVTFLEEKGGLPMGIQRMYDSRNRLFYFDLYKKVMIRTRPPGSAIDIEVPRGPSEKRSKPDKPTPVESDVERSDPEESDLVSYEILMENLI